MRGHVGFVREFIVVVCGHVVVARRPIVVARVVAVRGVYCCCAWSILVL